MLYAMATSTQSQSIEYTTMRYSLYIYRPCSVAMVVAAEHLMAAQIHRFKKAAEARLAREL